MDAFILSGQSNMAGRGGVINKIWDGCVPPESSSKDGKILRLDADLNWEAATEPLHKGIDIGKVCGIGPGLIFGSELIEWYDETGVSPKHIGLVPCARGGTDIDEWGRSGPLYQTMIKRSIAAVKSNFRIKALLWYQGESDCKTLESATSYTTKMENLVQNLRKDLNEPDLPVIQVGVTTSSLPTTQYLTELRQSQKNIKVKNVFYVDALGLNLQPDGLHLATNAQVRLGKMLAEKYHSEVLASCLCSVV